jgi:hypothetical protein
MGIATQYDFFLKGVGDEVEVVGCGVQDSKLFVGWKESRISQGRRSFSVVFVLPRF